MLQNKWWILGLSLACMSVACGSDDDGDGGLTGSGADSGSGANTGSGATGSGATGSGATGSGGTIGLGGGFGAGGSSASGNSGGSGASCSADFAKADLQPVYLAFAFDVSGSMGKGDFEWHDKSLKWDPIVAATKAFFADESSSGIQASLTFFPGPDDDTKCDSETYATPDVPMTPVPSEDFADAIDEVTPETSDDWRGGTPTLAVTTGTLGFLQGIVDDDPSAKYVYVLVSDGYPQGCDDDADDIAEVADAVADVADTIPTYVIGVSNPPIDGAPDTVSSLNEIAEAGGTDAAFLIETGNAEDTSAEFKAVIDSIREEAVSCQAEIPENPGGTPFDKEKVNVSFTRDGETMNLGYDPDCEGENAWRYDDEDEPTAIVLCPDTCQEIQGDSGADLSVAFGCETIPAVPK